MASKSKKEVLFGDYFSQRADYSNGFFYGGHRRYLNSSEMSPLEPPNEFKSKRQLKQQLRMSREGTSRSDERMFQVNFQQKKSNEPEEVDNHRKMKKVIVFVKESLVFEHYSSTKPEDWLEETQAGVKIWVNKHTGEVAPHCPWIKPSSNERRDEDPAWEEAEGTGSLVYDGSELQDLLSLLNNAK